MRNEEQFFQAWKAAVAIAGIEFFGDGTQSGFDHAREKWELCPRAEMIKANLPRMSPGCAIFLGALIAFYNKAVSRQMLSPSDLSSDIGDLLRMDTARTQAITALLHTYPGW
jgi:hypothetical protein